MLPIVAIVIVLAVVTVAAIFAIMALNVLRTGPTHRAVYDRRWCPPIASGTRLTAWASKVSQRVTQQLLSRRRTNLTPTELAEEILYGTTVAVHHAPHAQ